MVKLTGLVVEVNVAKVTDFSKVVVNVVKGTGLVVLVNEVKMTNLVFVVNEVKTTG